MWACVKWFLLGEVALTRLNLEVRFCMRLMNATTLMSICSRDPERSGVTLNGILLVMLIGFQLMLLGRLLSQFRSDEPASSRS